jgi:phosphate transport system permease protein
VSHEATADAAHTAAKAERAQRFQRILNRAHTLDTVGRWIISAAGIVVLACVAMILVFLATEAAPLLLHPDKHPDATLAKMFVPQQYEGYQAPQLMWQTEATENGQAKYGVPLLLFGTLKGAFWAMVFSLPLALLTALFIAEFARPRTRTVIKSAIECMAGIPTVVVGFFAFVTMSTVINDYYLKNIGYFAEGRWIVFVVQTFAFAIIASGVTGKIVVGYRPALHKALLAFMGVAATFVFVFGAGRLLEWVLGASLTPVFGITQYTQLNGIIAGFCLGFAVVPIIFSVAEDAMRAVPASYREASFALGASKWETALRVIVPSALPGIYAAVMLGLARAVGETMIVLMASGNTPILDMSPFIGMRTMSAAIAIEASEKAQYSTGYHVLFFVGALLFLITFVMNAVTAHVISKLKKRYRVGA